VRLTVLTTPDLAAAYRLAGTATLARSSAAEAELTLRELLEEGLDGVIAVHQPFLDALPAELTDRLERLESALVVGLPSAEAATGGEDRRTRLLRMLRHAVGYEMTFESEEGGSS
jgi:vacuolar-type H+-ATPase subunit F/Vma7